jgi:hypothetical protein
MQPAGLPSKKTGRKHEGLVCLPGPAAWQAVFLSIGNATGLPLENPGQSCKKGTASPPALLKAGKKKSAGKP